MTQNKDYTDLTHLIENSIKAIKRLDDELKFSYSYHSDMKLIPLRMQVPVLLDTLSKMEDEIKKIGGQNG